MFSELKSLFKSTLNYVHLSKELLALILAIDLIIAKPVKKTTNVLYLFLKFFRFYQVTCSSVLKTMSLILFVNILRRKRFFRVKCPITSDLAF